VEAPGFVSQFGPALEVSTGPYVANIGLAGRPVIQPLYLPALRRSR
jgi:hypothetical protein